MKNDWKTVKIREIASFNNDSYSLKDNWNYVNYLDTGSITENKIEFIQYIDLNKEDLPSRAKRKVDNDDIVYSTVRPNQLHYGFIQGKPENFLVSTGFAVVKCLQEYACPKYIYYYLIQDQITEYLQSIAEQSVSAYPSIKSSDIGDLEIELPDLETQKKIAKVLSALDDKIELNNQINKNLEEQAQSIFKRCFIDNEESLHWENVTFSNLVVSTISGDWGKDSPSGNNKEEVYCIRGADIPEVQKGNIEKMPIRYILSKNLLSKQLSAGDIVVEISGGSPTQSTGRCASITQSLLNRYGGKMICTNFCRAIKVVPGYSAFVYYFLRYLYDKGTFFAYENGTTGIKNLDLTGFLETESIMIPPKAKIEEFDMLSQSVFSQIYANGKQNDGLSKLRDTLLPKLMSGEIDVDNVEI